jgi:hypothetical protein
MFIGMKRLDLKGVENEVLCQGVVFGLESRL